MIVERKVKGGTVIVSGRPYRLPPGLHPEVEGQRVWIEDEATCRVDDAEHGISTASAVDVFWPTRYEWLIKAYLAEKPEQFEASTRHLHSDGNAPATRGGTFFHRYDPRDFRVAVTMRTAAGNLVANVLPVGVRLSDIDTARAIVERQHKKLGHHLRSDGTEREDQFFAGFVQGCVPQSEARSLLERQEKAAPGSVPESVLKIIEKGGIESMILLYALTLKRAHVRARPGGGVWIGHDSPPKEEG